MLDQFISAIVSGFTQLMELMVVLFLFLLIPLLEAYRTKLYGLFRVSRPFNCLIAALAILSLFRSSAAAIVASLAVAGGNAINDYFDRDIDKVNAKHRPIPSKQISPKLVFSYSFFMFALAIIVAYYYLPFLCQIIALFNIFLLILYSWKLKRRYIFLPNLVISYLTASIFIFGYLATYTNKWGLYLAIPTFLCILSREIVKDLEDIKGDKLGKKTLPLTFGKTKASMLAKVFLILAWLSLVVLCRRAPCEKFFFISLIPITYFIGSALAYIALSNYTKSQNYIKYAFSTLIFSLALFQIS